MAKGTYTYEPGNITTAGLDLMRFELGDTMVEGGADTCALTDEEISAALKNIRRSGKEQNSCCWKASAEGLRLKWTRKKVHFLFHCLTGQKSGKKIT